MRRRTHRNRRKRTLATLLAAAGFLAVVGASCGPQNGSPPAVREENIKVPDAPPADLLALAEESADEASRLAERRFGGHADGYFVVYAEQNVKPPRHGGIYFYRYEYEVLRGLTAAAAYAKALSEKWSWQRIQRFPETPHGREQAYARWRDLLKKKRRGKS